MTSTTAIISTDQFLSSQDAEIFAREINERIAQLDEEIRQAQQGGEELDEDDDRVAEYDELVAFRDEVERLTGNHFDSATIVPAHLFADFARDWAGSIADIDWLAPFVDWERFALTLKDDYRAIAFGSETVYVK